MPIYHYQATNAAGQSISADINAPTPQEASAKIRAQGCFPTELNERPSRRSKKPAPSSRKSFLRMNIALGRVPNARLADFTRQLAILQDAGLPILRSLRILGLQQRPGLLKNVLEAVAADVESGSTLSDAFARHPRAFENLYVNMVHAGEAGGVLDVILNRLADFLEKAQRLKRRILGAMIYPAVVIAFSILILTGIMIFVVPKFEGIFKDFQTPMPALTVWLMATSNFIARRYGWALILGSPLALLFILKLIRKSDLGRLVLDKLRLRLPILGRIIAKSTVARFSRTLGTLLAAGVPILDALAITRATIGNVVYERALKKVHNAIREGESFAAPLRAAKVCDHLVINMIDVGEETGDLDKMLIKIADTYDEQVDVLIGSLVSLLEPLMVVVLGTIVGTIVLALFLPLVAILEKMTM